MAPLLTRLRAWGRSRPRLAAAFCLLSALSLGLGLLAVVGGAARPQVAELTAAPAPRAQAPAPPRPPPPAGLQARLEDLAEAYGEDVGVAVMDVQSGWIAGVDLGGAYPQQSVSKLWVALAVLKAVDEGRLDVDGWVTLRQEDRSVFFQPVAGNIGPAGYTTQISGLLRRAIVQSDNAANDRLMREAGGPDRVADTLRDLGLSGVTVGAYERDLQARVAGLVWRPEYGVGWNFQEARAGLSPDVRRAALEAYLADPLDGAQPGAVVQALARLHRGELLSPASTDRLLDLMTQVRTGPRRLKGGLSPGWRIGHKTGTGQDYGGASVGINDVGLLTAPDGRTYAVAVMMRLTRHAVPARLEFMQSVTRAVAQAWAAERAGRGAA